LKKLGKMNWKKLYSVDISANNLQESSLKILIKFDWRNITHLNIGKFKLTKLKTVLEGKVSKNLLKDIGPNYYISTFLQTR
jgi:CHASE2 domain-containing sensor protein